MLLTLALLSFLVLIAIALATFTKVDTQLSDTNLKLNQARANALTGMRLALGKLQAEAGRDMRVTYQGRFLANGAPSGSDFWTAVADANSPGSGRVWLVSNGGISTTEGDDVLVSTNTAGSAAANSVKAPRVKVPGGTISFWIGEEGGKANIAIADRVDQLTVATGSAVSSVDQRDRIRQLIPVRSGSEAIDALSVSGPSDQNWKAWWQTLPA